MQRKRCNVQACHGDEVCVAKQDLVIAVDGSGSLRESGFDILKKFTKKLVNKMKQTAFGRSASQIAVIQFGNGKILPDGGISVANTVQPLTEDLTAVKTAVDGLTWQKGFTNMAQAFTAAETVFMEGRKDAQKVMMVITDGKPSFKFQTQSAVDNLKDAGVRVVMVPIKTSLSESEEDTMKNWASEPESSNLIKIDGLKMLEATMNQEVTRTLTSACTRSVSPELSVKTEREDGYGLRLEDKWCKDMTKKPVGDNGDWHDEVEGLEGFKVPDNGVPFDTPANCHAVLTAPENAEKYAKVTNFQFGTAEFNKGKCIAYSGNKDVEGGCAAYKDGSYDIYEIITAPPPAAIV
jgi:Mg-chelatase subunit ChlD